MNYLTKLIKYGKNLVAKLGNTREEDMPRTFVFGYGSLLNENSLQGTLPGKKHAGWADLQDYRRVFNKAGLEHAYLNIRKEEGSVVRGVLVEVNPSELARLAQREQGYELVDVTDYISPVPEDAQVLTFIAPGLESMPVRGSYLRRMLEGVPKEEHDRWMAETDFQGRKVDESS